MFGVVGLGGVFDNAGIPHGSHSEFLDGLEYLVGDLIHFTYTVLLDGAVGDTIGGSVGEESGKYLIYNWFHGEEYRV